MTNSPLPVVCSVGIYRRLIGVHPLEFRREFGEAMTQLFADLARDAYAEKGLFGLACFWLGSLKDLIVSALAQHVHCRSYVIGKSGWASTNLCIPAVGFWIFLALGEFLGLPWARSMLNVQTQLPVAAQIVLWLGLPLLAVGVSLGGMLREGLRLENLATLTMSSVLSAIIFGAAFVRVS
jgi:hypothetical protein